MTSPQQPEQPETRPGLELSVARAEDLLKGVMIPPRPTILVELMSERGKKDPDLDRIGDIISRDVALSASMLKVVNSPFYGLRNRIGGIHHAVRLLGIANVVNISSGLMLRSAFADQRGGFMDSFWRESARNGAVATILARETRLVKPEDSYAAGLFCDCGVPILARRFPQYSELYSQAQLADVRTFTEIEEEHLGTSHAVVGYMMANSWMLPDDLGQVILSHHDPEDAFEGETLDAQQRLQAVLMMALQVTRTVDGLPTSAEWARSGERIMEVARVDDLFMARIIDEVGALPAQGFEV